MSSRAHAALAAATAPPVLTEDAARLLAHLESVTREPRFAQELGIVPGEFSEAHWHRAVLEPLRNFLSRPGKCFRSRLVEWSWRAAGGLGHAPDELLVLIEMLHAGSLIVDDIEDGAETRRGAPALHQTHGVPRALNAGNWLYFWPTVLLERMNLNPIVERDLHRLVGRALWRCHCGQALDIDVRVEDVTQAELPGIVSASTELKTGCLMGLAASAPASASGAPSDVVAGFERLGRDFGLGLQMLDDLSSLVSDRHLEKGREDFMTSAPTWAWAWAAEQLGGDEYSALIELQRRVSGGQASFIELRERLSWHVGVYGRARVREQLATVESSAESLAASPEVAEQLRREIARLEKAYG